MFATERSRQNMRLAGALLLVIAGRVYLSNGGVEAMVFTPPRLNSRYEAQMLLAYVALAVAVSAAIAAAGKRWVGRLTSVALGGVAGLLAINQYNAILGAIIGLIVGLLVACGIFLGVLAGTAKIVAATAFGDRLRRPLRRRRAGDAAGSERRPRRRGAAGDGGNRSRCSVDVISPPSNAAASGTDASLVGKGRAGEFVVIGRLRFVGLTLGRHASPCQPSEF
jgi:hypothetical protein